MTTTACPGVTARARLPHVRRRSSAAPFAAIAPSDRSGLLVCRCAEGRMKILGTVLVVAALLVAAFAAYYFSLEYRNESRIIERGEERASEAVRKAEAA